MAITLADVKNYCRIDTDVTDDDALITSLISAAKQYIVRQSGKAYVEDDEVWNLAVKMTVAHWYEHREAMPEKTGFLAEVPHSVDALIRHISMCALYEEATS